MIVAIDGPAGCGKSTIAKMLSENLGFTYINSGNIYRAIALEAIREGLRDADPATLTEAARGASISYGEDGSLRLSGKIVDGELRSAEVDAIVAQVSAIPEIRRVVDRIVRDAAEGRDSVVEGRDMTTVVFPNADLKFYLDASPAVRAKRRFDQRSSSMNLEEIEKNIAMRDRIDTTKPVGALKIADDACYLDTSGLTIDEVYAKVYTQILRIRDDHGQ